MAAGNRRHPVIWLLKRVLRLFYPRHKVFGMERVQAGNPVVFVCNHRLSYGPIVVSLDLPYLFRPWVQASVVDRRLCRGYLEEDFVRKELKLAPPLSQWLAAVIAPLCLRLMKSIEAIPVYRGQVRMRQTFDTSVDALQAGWNIVIFPESQTEPFSVYINDFQTGFAFLARRYHQATGKVLRFHPVYVSGQTKTITIGDAVCLAEGQQAQSDWRNLAIRLRDAVNRLALR